MIRRYIAWRNRHADDDELRTISKRANVARRGTRPVAEIIKVERRWTTKTTEDYHSSFVKLQSLELGRDHRGEPCYLEDDISHPTAGGIGDGLPNIVSRGINSNYTL
jgi:hypothetical protein